MTVVLVVWWCFVGSLALMAGWVALYGIELTSGSASAGGFIVLALTSFTASVVNLLIKTGEQP